MEKNEFPSKDKVEGAIKRMSSMTLPAYDESKAVKDYIEDITHVISKEFGLLFHLGKPTKQKSFKLPIYRVRELKTIANPNLFHEHSYPPSHIVGMGRCNFPKFPVFYGSTDPSIAILEVLRSYEPTDMIYCMSVWDVEPSEDIFLLQTFLNVPLPDENVFAKLNHNLKEKLKEQTFKDEAEITDDQIDALEEYLTYFDTQFIQDNSYSISATLAHRCIYMDHSFRTDMLMYPSIQAKMKGVNLAISPNFVDHNMKIRRLYTFKVSDINLDKGYFNLSFVKCGIIQKNVIHWQEFDADKPEHMELLKKDFHSISSIHTIAK